MHDCVHRERSAQRGELQLAHQPHLRVEEAWSLARACSELRSGAEARGALDDLKE